MFFMNMSPMQKAIDLVGLAKIANAFNPPVSVQAVSKWASPNNRVPAERCPEIEKVTGGGVTCEELRPDIDWAYLRSTGCKRGKKAA